MQAWGGLNKTLKLVAVRFRLYKRGASLNYSPVERSEYFNRALTNKIN